MGLDVTFFERVEFVGEHATEWIDADGVTRECDHRVAYTSGGFPRTEAGVPSGQHFEESGESLHWSLNYAGYSMFRACLLHTVRPDLVTAENPYYPRVWTDEITAEEFQSWPFNELIWFSDCEGTYGPEVAAKLLSDFRKHEHRIDSSALELFPAWGSMFGKLYREYMAGLEIVGDQGLVTYG